MKEKILISFSGGLDSSTLLGYLLDQGYDVIGVSFNYGSKHNQFENMAAVQVANFYKIKLIQLDITKMMLHFKSNLLISGGQIPEGHYTDASMEKTVVPARNMIFISILTGIAVSHNISKIGLGVHSGDHAIYPDCRPGFIKSMQTSIKFATDGQVKEIITPFLDLTKIDIVKIGLNLDPMIPYGLTRTCYKNDAIACGKCGSCVERLEAFAKNGLIDPIVYK